MNLLHLASIQIEGKLMGESRMRVIVDKKCILAEGICGVRLADVDGAALPRFSAGSHIDVHLPGDVVRQYSLCNPPDTTHYEIAVLREPASRGGAVAIHEIVQPGDVLEISRPRNHFALETGSRPLLIAGGIGITPILCMAERLALAGRLFEMHYLARSRRHAAFCDRIEDGAFRDQVRFYFADEHRGSRIDLGDILSNPAAERQIYVCGPARLIEGVRERAVAIGWRSTQVRFEYFAAASPMLEASRDFEVQVASTGQIFTVPGDQTVVEVLGQAGIEIPISCEQGVCGTCLTRVLEGQPDHRDYILSDDEKAANNQFAPCCSRSVSARLVLDL